MNLVKEKQTGKPPSRIAPCGVAPQAIEERNMPVQECGLVFVLASILISFALFHLSRLPPCLSIKKADIMVVIHVSAFILHLHSAGGLLKPKKTYLLWSLP